MFNHFVAPAGYVAVKQTNIPAYNWDQTVVEKPPVYIDNQWTQQWAVVDLDPDKKQEKLSMEADGIRAKRNRLLSECDWTQLPDVTLDSVKRTQWNQYRQSLRDITSQPGFPLQINWPISP